MEFIFINRQFTLHSCMLGHSGLNNVSGTQSVEEERAAVKSYFSELEELPGDAR